MELTTQYLASLKHDWINHRRAAILATLIVIVGTAWAWLTFAADDPIAGFAVMVVGALLVTVGAIAFGTPIEKWFEAAVQQRSGYTFSQLMNIVSLPAAQRAAEHQQADQNWRNAQNAVAGMAVGKWVNWCNWMFPFIGVILLFASSSFAYERWKEDQPRSPLVIDAPTIEIFKGIATPPPDDSTGTTTPNSSAPSEQDPLPDGSSAPQRPAANGPTVVMDPTKKTDPIDPGKTANTVTNLAVNTELNVKATHEHLEKLLTDISNISASSPDASKRIEDLGNHLEMAQDYLNKLQKDDLIPADLRDKAGELSNSINQAQKTLSDSSKSLEEKAKAVQDLAEKIAEFLKLLGDFLGKLGSFMDQLFGSDSGLGKSLKKAGEGLRKAGEKTEGMAGRAKEFTQQLGRQLEHAKGVVRIAKGEWDRGGADKPVDSADPASPTAPPDLGADGKRPKSTKPAGEQTEDPSGKTPGTGALPGPK